MLQTGWVSHWPGGSFSLVFLFILNVASITGKEGNAGEAIHVILPLKGDFKARFSLPTIHESSSH